MANKFWEAVCGIASLPFAVTGGFIHGTVNELKGEDFDEGFNKTLNTVINAAAEITPISEKARKEGTSMYRTGRAMLIALMLVCFVAIFTSSAQNAFASTRPTGEQWNGFGTADTGGSFPMRVHITSNNLPYFTGTLNEGPRGLADISGYFGSGEFAPYGAFYFTTVQRLSGSMCPNCSFSGTFVYPDQSLMKGDYYAPLGGGYFQHKGIFQLARVG